jgi:diguanylate cyclase (GGDEF)-like protein
MAMPPFRRKSDSDRRETLALQALVVEDDPQYASYVSTLAQRFGFTVVAAADGRDALKIAKTGTQFDLLLVDWEMPGISGIDVIEALRQQEQYADVYAIMLTSHESAESRIGALRAGYDDFVSKSAGDVVSRQRRLDATVRELYGLATRDELTGVYNRRFFFAEAERLLAEERRVDLLFIDFDDFKLVNDTWGHLAGDRILRDVGEVLVRTTRDEDVIARYGGDEFVMLVIDLEPPAVEKLAERLARAIAALQWAFGGHPLTVTATTGFACSTLLERPTISQLLTAGDRDLYKNKWLKKHPDLDPSLYEYDANREAHVIELVAFDRAAIRRS